MMQSFTLPAGKNAAASLLTAILSVQVAFAASTAVSAAPGNTSTAVSAPITTVFDASVFAYVYAIPLAAFAQLATPVLAALGTNKVLSAAQLSGPSAKTVVRPNVDTLYSTAILDLSQDDLILTVPNISDGRYWLFPFYDLYGNNFASASIIAKSPPGDYLIRRASDSLQQPGITYTSTSVNCIPRYVGIVDYPTTYGTLLVRILVEANTTADLNKVHKYQNAIKLVTTPRTISQPYTLPAPALTSALLSSNATTSFAKLLDLLARFAPTNPPIVLSDAYRVASTLGLAGLTGGVYTAPSGINTTAIIAASNASIAAVARTAANQQLLGNGWSVLKSQFSGTFGSNYAARALIAQSGYLQLTTDQVIYPSYASPDPSAGGTSLDKNESYLVTFSRRPPILSEGFWSLTVYGADQFLVENSLDRYEVGDRTDGLKFENGGVVYGGNASQSDGPFQVLIQAADVAPPANWTSKYVVQHFCMKDDLLMML
jgi:hypothetical protein